MQVVFRAGGPCAGCCGRRTSWASPGRTSPGDVDLEGDVFTGVGRADRLADPERGPGIVVDGRTRAAVAGAVAAPGRARAAAAAAGRGGPAGRPAAHTAARRRGGDPPLRRRQRLLRAGPRSVADLLVRLLRRRPGRPHAGGRAAGQVRPRRPQARPGAGHARAGRRLRLGDLRHPRGPHVRRRAVVGVTLSPAQADAVPGDRVADAGVGDRVEIRVQDYRDVTDGPFDAIASIGMAEHVGLRALPDYAAHLHALLAPGDGCSTTRSPGGPDRPDEPSTDLLHRALRLPRRRARAARRPWWTRWRGRFRGPRRGVAARALRPDTLRAWVANLESALGRGGRADAAPAGRGCGGSTWPGRRSRSRPTGSGSTRCSRSGRTAAGSAACRARGAALLGG